MNIKQIHEAIKDYHWMMKLLISKRNEIESSSTGLTAIYGIASSMPKPQGETSDPVYQEMLRIEEHDQNTKRIKERVMFIQKHLKAVTNPKDKIILDMLLNGLPLREIALEINMSISGVDRRKSVIVNQIFQSGQKEKAKQKGKAKNIS